MVPYMTVSERCRAPGHPSFNFKLTSMFQIQLTILPDTHTHKDKRVILACYQLCKHQHVLFSFNSSCLIEMHQHIVICVLGQLHTAVTEQFPLNRIKQLNKDTDHYPEGSKGSEIQYSVSLTLQTKNIEEQPRQIKWYPESIAQFA